MVEVGNESGRLGELAKPDRVKPGIL